ncbi:uncharacterized protein GGS22DRAFT_168565 [Annulohypoxylon maeteangense]|uniref:uncharacterized protein n=1 Tax=Annulohypoxylon maeteangense TaxID=1927788 RepID=UPI002008A6E2|nr:uncharacterized protein GGS22DRAFT_168565 [Annulohypoxylon maeteangense]KAI0882717.1 hypothetical protein GGS22DRAFT_168565 [Annulohypoxylon maeteangense]
MASGDESASASIAIAFEDFDQYEVFQKAEKHVRDEESKNFVVEFGLKRARIAFDVNDDEMNQLLNQAPDDHRDYPIRWINVWDPSAQRDTMTSIGEKYGFSPRLLGLMTTPRSQPEGTRRHNHRRKIALRHHQRSNNDLEKGEATNGSFSKPQASAEVNDSIALYLQVKDTVNYFSTDQTQKAFCIGANWLHKRPVPELEHPRISIMPPKHWQWLALCNNHTVLSIHEKPLFEPVPEKENKESWRNEEFESMRAHILDILRQLSTKGFDLYKTNPLAQSSVRESLPNPRKDLNRTQSGVSVFSNSEAGSLADEGTSNLFYYLFEDYVAAGPLKAAEQELDEMTHKILDSTRRSKVSKSSEIIPTLHYLSKDLREFKHLFENYKNLISKIMAVGRRDSSQSIHLDADHKVFLTNSALSRFDRLRDRLQYLMLNTIEGYLEEIAALSTTYFNLTQQKDSQATARLTRSATLLAKLSVFFLPISFMTSYFSVQIEDLYIYWTGKTYWYAFAVIASVSFVSLFFFSRLLMLFSDMMDEWAAFILDRGNDVLRHMKALVGWKPNNGDED